MSFKLIAIRPLKNCNPKFLKNLKEGKIYQFYDNYVFKDYNDEVIGNHNKVKVIEDLTEVKYNIFDEEDIKINISAIVGKNGSGKSSIVELLYAFIFCLSNSEQINLINNDDFINNHILSKYKKSERIKFKNKIEREIEDFYKSLQELKTLSLEIYYLIEDETTTLYKIRKKNDFKITSYVQKVNIFESQKERNLSNDCLPKDFFYSIVVNYSKYGLNTNDIGIWLKSIFHKNDGYQTPIVLNPMRTDGNIDINTETYLTKSRLMTNIFAPVIDNNFISSLRNLSNGKITDKLHVDLDVEKFNLLEDDEIGKYNNGYDDEFVLKINSNVIDLENSRLYRNKYFILILNYFRNQESELISLNDSNFFQNLSNIQKLNIEYILRKAKSISQKYSNYKEFKSVFSIRNNERKIHLFLAELSEDQSHVAYKIRQAINFFRYDLYKFKNTKNIRKSVFDIDQLSIKINSKINSIIEEDEKQIRIVYNKETERRNRENYPRMESEDFIYLPNFKHNLIYFIPPSFLKIEIKFKDNKGYFNNLSSGEKQRIYSFASIIYHLKNLKSKTDVFKYDYYNIIFDEIELYFHPEFQRTFIFELINNIKKIGSNFFGINVIFITHSPFILSDIPSSNVLFLKNEDEVGMSINKNEKVQTFASNIHELLMNGFFMNSTKGEFAISKINKILHFYKKVKEADDIDLLQKKYTKEKDTLMSIINLIGEDYIKNILINHIREIEEILKIPASISNEDLKRRKEELVNELDKINQQLLNDSN